MMSYSQKLETVRRSLATIDRDTLAFRYGRAAVSTTTNRNSAITEIPHRPAGRPAGRQRLLATYFIGRHICRWQGDRLSND